MGQQGSEHRLHICTLRFREERIFNEASQQLDNLECLKSRDNMVTVQHAAVSLPSSQRATRTINTRSSFLIGSRASLLISHGTHLTTTRRERLSETSSRPLAHHPQPPPKSPPSSKPSPKPTPPSKLGA